MALEDRIGLDLSGYSPAPASPPAQYQPEQSLLPKRDSMLRFTAPYLPGTFPSSDTLRGFHLGGIIPQYRIPVPPQNNLSGTVTSTSSAVTISSTSSSVTTNNPPHSQTASITTSILNPAGQFTGVITMAKSFVVLTITVNNPARVRLYSTLAAQTSDLGRPLTQGPGYATEQGIIGDVALDTAPVIWQAVDMQGSNNDNPQSTTIYVSIDNISQATQSVTASVAYVPLQS